MSWQSWSPIDDRGLARYVTPESSKWLTLKDNRHDLLAAPDGRLKLTESIYQGLISVNVRYDLESFEPSAEVQKIRTPAEVLHAPRRGTCLELAALFCGLCLDNELLPILIVAEGHAYMAVSLKTGLREWDGYRKEREWFDNGPLTDPEKLWSLIDDESFIAIECTGFAHSLQLSVEDERYPETQGRSDGVLSFERAVEAGKQQLRCPSRPLRFALDIAIAHYSWKLEPLSVDAPEAQAHGSIYQAFLDSSAQLSSQIRVEEFRTLVDERTSAFVGRDFVFSAIDNAVEDPDFPSGYITVRGEPGIGKTSIMAEIVKRHGYVHHFNIALQGIRSPRAFLSNVCAQLIVKYDLGHHVLPANAIEDGGFLNALLAKAAASRSQGDAIVVVVDALDEADDSNLPSTANRLFLPGTLPDGVYFVVSMREEYHFRLSVDRSRPIFIREDDPRNSDDIFEFVAQFIASNHKQMQFRIGEWDLSEKEFAKKMSEKSEGNFMYLVHVLRDIRDGLLTKETIDSIDNLPVGLGEYYKGHWELMKAKESNQDRFEQLYEPVICMLATIREPVSIAQIMAWTERKLKTKLKPSRVRGVIRDWREFLNEVVVQGGSPLYRVYHSSFQEFLDQEVGLQEFHATIADSALDKIPGFRERFSEPK